MAIVADRTRYTTLWPSPVKRLWLIISVWTLVIGKSVTAESALCRPDFTNTEPAVNIGPFPAWGNPNKIVAMDPWGHLAPWAFKDVISRDQGAHLRSSWTAFEAELHQLSLPRLQLTSVPLLP